MNRVQALDQKRKGRLAVGVVGVLLSIGYTYQAFRIPAGEAIAPGPGLFPRYVGFVAVVISVIVVLEALLTDVVSGKVDLPNGGRLKRVVLFSLATIALVVLIPILGQYLAAALYMVAMIRLLSDLPWPRVVLYGLVGAVACTWFFTDLLGIHLPRGIW